MIEYFVSDINSCSKEFKNLLKSDKYINKKQFDQFLDKYQDSINYIIKNNIELNEIMNKNLEIIINSGYKIVEERNKKYVDNKLVEYKDYFDNMFKEIDPNIMLDEEQRKAIIIDEDYSLVIAGAGSGKTTTMAAKVKYLIEKCRIDPKKIILIAFTNKAADELGQRINEDLKLNVEVLTFHKLGMKFIRSSFEKNVQIVKDGTLYDTIKQYFKNVIFPNKNKLYEIMQYFKKYVSFDQDVLKYENFNEYFDYYVDKKYEENKNNLDDYIKKSIKNRYKSLRTINGETVKSIGEVKIANYLYCNGYSYMYEKMYPHKVENNRSYSPDFTVFSGEIETYIEFYGLATYFDNGRYSIDDVEAYNRLIDKKKELHQKYGTDLIELYYQYEEDTDYIKELYKNLSKRNISHEKRTKKDIFYRLLYTNQEAQYFKFINLVLNFINKFKEKGYAKEEFEKLKTKTNDFLLKKQLDILKEIYIYYEEKIHSEYKVDFNDMINYGYRIMDKVKNQYEYLDYDYLIIDEYQDISNQRYNFAKKLSDLFNAKIVAVGDDWQSIFAFSGSEVDLFTKFYDYMGYAEIIKIIHTYRNSQELVDVAGEFVSRNESQFTKTLLSDKHLDKPIEIHYYNDNIKEEDVLENIVGKIYKENPTHKILLIGRYKADIELYLESGKFTKGSNDRIISNKYPSVFMEFMSIHSSKGLGYDQVILLNALNDTNGFPSKIEDEDVIKLLNTQPPESIEYPEERRLFYVALTRTKNKVYILCPYSPYIKRSEFVREIAINDNVYENKS